MENCSVEAPKVTNEAAELPDDATTVTTATGAVVGYAHPEAAVKDVATSDAKVESNNPEYTDKGDGLGFQGDLEITPEEPEQPEVPEVVYTTVAEFLAAAEDNTVYQLTGVITSVTNTTYGNFYLKDETGEVLIYGLCSPEGQQKYWAESGAKVGDTITVQTKRTSYNSTPQGKDAIFVELKPYSQPSEWGIVGDLTNWSNSGIPDVVMYTIYGYENLFVAHNVEIASGAFKIRANNEWNDAKNYGLSVAGKIYADKYYALTKGAGSQNATPMAYGTYDVYFDLANERVALVTPGKEYADAENGGDPVVVVEGLKDHTWGLIGSFAGSSWGTDVAMEVVGDWAVAKNVTLANGNEFKFRADGGWTLSYGAGCDVNVGETYTTYNNGGNMKFVGEAGAYNIYFSLVDAKFYMEKYSAGFNLVTANQDDWSGKYLIVWGTGAHASLSGKDLKKTVDVEIVDGVIENKSDYASAIVTVTKDGDNYYMALPNGKYFGMQHNGSLLCDEPFTLNFAYTESGIEISGVPSGKTDNYYLYNNGNQYYRCYVHKNGQSGYYFPTLYKLQ